jgi:tetratricopeptide (TPR) repeat protein
VIVPLLVAAFVTSGPPDPCAPVVAAPRRDPETAVAYQAVADEERAAGRTDSAALAYRAALERDPSLARARGALAELCAARRRNEAFAGALAQVRAGDCKGALPALEAERAAGDVAAALLAGLCRYRLGEDEAAAAALRQAAAAPETRASAELYLGLLALRGGRPGEASPLFQAAAADPALAPVARELAREARQEGRLVVSVVAEAGWDSNVDAAPGGPGSALGAVTALVTAAPWRDRGPYARGAATYQAETRRRSLDLLAASAAVGLPLGTARRHLLLEYGYDDRRVGGEPYLAAHRLLLDGRAALGDRWLVGAAYTLRGEHYRAADAADDSGIRHAAELDAGTTVRGARLSAAWQVAWHGARASARSYREHGPLVALTAPAGDALRVVLEAAYTWRAYGAVDPDLERRRSDGYADLAARVEWPVRDRWTAYLSLAGRRASSNVSGLRYGRVVSTVGASFTGGVP